MANDPRVMDDNTTIVDRPDEAPPRRRRRGPAVDPSDMLSPTCMFWVMTAVMVVLAAVIIIWGISNIDKIVQ